MPNRNFGKILPKVIKERTSYRDKYKKQNPIREKNLLRKKSGAKFGAINNTEKSGAKI
jgi:hypothetical protein